MFALPLGISQTKLFDASACRYRSVDIIDIEK